MVRATTLKAVHNVYYKDIFAYTTFRNIVKENIDSLKESMLIKKNAVRTTYRIVDIDNFVKQFNAVLK